MEIIKSFRKSISMKIDSTGKIIVKAPFFTSNKTIESFILKHKNWIEEKKALVIDRVKTYTQWEKFMYFGEEYELKYTWESKIIQDKWWKQRKSSGVEFDGMYFYLDKKYKKDAAILFADFYKKEARIYIEKRINFIANKYNLTFNKLKITSAKTRWGSCTSRKNINFSYRLALVPIRSVDYVIVHELAHLKEMNHSKQFWDIVDEMMKWLSLWDYKTHKKWFNDNGDKIIF